jgi:peptidoglycan hydrolase CwlO-like protein
MKYSRNAISLALNGNEKYLTDKLFESVCKAYPDTFNLDYLLTGNGELITKKEPETAPIDKQQDALTYAAIQVGKMMADLSNSIASVREFQKKLEEREEQLEHMTSTLTDRIAQLDKLTATLARQDHRIPGLESIDMAAEPLKKHAK